MFDKQGKVGAVAVSLIDIVDDRLNRLGGGEKRVGARRLKTDLVVIDAPDEAVQRSSHRDATVDFCHIRAAVQRVAGTIQLVSNMKRRAMPLTRLKIVVNDLEMARGFL